VDRHDVDGEDGGLLLRIGVGPIAAGFAAFAIGFIFCLGLTLDTERANVGSRADARDSSVSSTIRPQPVDSRMPSATAGWDIRGDRAHLASLQRGTVAELASEGSGNQSEPARAAFAERFSFDQPNPPNSSLQRSFLSASFDDRHIGDILPPGAAISSVRVAPPAAAPRVAAAAVPVPRPAPKRPSESRFQLASASDTSVSLAYAPSGLAKSLATPFTLLAFGADETAVSAFEQTASALSVPLKIRRDSFEAGRQAYASRLVLVRPDQYIAWCGSDAPPDIANVMRKVTGM
jgi:hypothetical protein